MCVPGGRAREQQGQSQYDHGEINASEEMDDTELGGEALRQGREPKGEVAAGAARLCQHLSGDLSPLNPARTRAPQPPRDTAVTDSPGGGEIFCSGDHNTPSPLHLPGAEAKCHTHPLSHRMTATAKLSFRASKICDISLNYLSENKIVIRAVK